MSILVIDVGSSSVRAALVDTNTLATVRHASRKHHFDTEPPGAATADPIQLRELTEACIDEILKSDTEPIQAVGMATFVGNVLGVDSAGKPITPIYSYADTRSAEDVESLRDQINLAATHQRTGCPHHTAYLPGRLHWLDRTGVDAVRWLDFGTYLYQGWFGREVPCSYSVASWSGLLDRAKLTWDETWLGILKLETKKLPSLADYNAVQHNLCPTYASRWPTLRDVPFCLAVGDGAAANIGSGAVKADQIALTVGTTAALRRISADGILTVPQGLWSYRVDQAHHLTGGATSEGGNIFQWIDSTFKLPGDSENQLLKRTPGEHGLTFLPLLAGERSPGWHADAVGTINGIRLSTSPLDVLQAGMEGVALRLSLIAAQLTNDAANQLTVFASGGALNASPAWTQFIADALNSPLHMVAELETTTRGVAILALTALEKHKLTDFIPPISHIVEPRHEFVEAMQNEQKRQMALYNLLYGK